MKTRSTNNIFLSEINNKKQIRRYIKSSLINFNNKKFNIPIIKDINNLNTNDTSNENSNFFSLKNGANTISPYKNNNRIRKIKNNIEEIVIKTNYPRKNLSFNNTIPIPIFKPKQNYKLSNEKLKIKKLLFLNNNSAEKYPYSKEDEKNNSLEKIKRKTFSKSFRGSSNIKLNEEKINSISIENSNRYSNKKNKYIKKILHNSDINIKSKIKIDSKILNNNEINKKIFIKKNINLIPINPKIISTNLNLNTNSNRVNTIFNNQMTNVTNVTFDTSVQNDFFNFTDANNQNIENENKTTNNELETEIKLKIQENNEIKANILLLIEEIKKIKERQEHIINIENDNKIKNNEKNIKISNIIKKTYNFLNDFNKVINEQNQQIYQDILSNLDIFFNN